MAQPLLSEVRQHSRVRRLKQDKAVDEVSNEKRKKSADEVRLAMADSPGHVNVFAGRHPRYR
jgi:hypothetical protein